MADLKLIPLEPPRYFTPTGAGVPAPEAGQSAPAYLAALIEAGHLVDAQTFLAGTLPRREAIWWGTRCVRAILGPAPSPPVEAALLAAEAWVTAPGDSNRRRAFAAAEAAGFGDPAGCVALAAFLSSGSLAPAGLKEVPPPADAFPRALAGALQLAAARAEPAQIAATHRHFLDLGLAVARGDDRWPLSL